MTGHFIRFATVGVLALSTAVATAGDRPKATADDTVQERLRRLEERVQEHEEKIEAEAPAPLRAPEDLRVYWKDGVAFETLDKNFQFKIGGRIHNDWAVLDGDRDLEAAVGNLENGVEFRRARLYIQGLLYERVEFKAEYDFADGESAFKDVYLGLVELPVVGGVRVGHFKEPFSLEELTSSNYITFMSRALPNAFAPSRNTGVMLHDAVLDERVTWAAGAFRDTDDFGNRTGDGEWNVTGRVTGLPWWADDGRQLLHLGAAYSYRNPNDETIRFRQRPEIDQAPRFVDTAEFGAENAQLVGGEAALVVGPASLQGEYIHSTADANGRDPDFHGWYVFGSVFLTGEHRPYKRENAAFDRVKPRRNFLYGENAGLGAIELAARYSQIDLDDGGIDGGELGDVTVGINWYLNPNVRVMANYVFADLDDVGEANMFQMRFQLAL